MIMNYYRNIDRTRIQFDFLTHRPDHSDYDDEIISLGGKIYHAPRLYPHHYPAYFRYMKDFFQEHPEYKILHSHIDSMSYLPLLTAKKAGVPVRIAHSHSTGIDRDLKYPLKQYFRHQLGRVTTHAFSCGKEAGEFLFRGKDFTVVPNAVDPIEFHFSAEMRQKKREELGLSDKFIIGHVGRMCYPKNHEFLFSLLSELLNKRPEAVLLLVGTGEKEQELKEKADFLGLSSSVIFLGNRGDVNELYQAMDIFVLPSFFEGIPVVGIEAQFAGLPCLFSEGVPEEVCFSKTCRFQSLDQPVSVWADDVFSLADSANRNEIPEYSTYDVRAAAVNLQNYYENLLKNERVIC